MVGFLAFGWIGVVQEQTGGLPMGDTGGRATIPLEADPVPAPPLRSQPSSPGVAQPQGGPAHRLFSTQEQIKQPEDGEDSADTGEAVIFATTEQGLKEAVGSIKSPVKSCFEAWLLAVPELSGRVTIAFTIETRQGVGVVTEVGVDHGSSTIEHGLLSGCIVNHVASLRFEPVDDAVTLILPFALASG